MAGSGNGEERARQDGTTARTFVRWNALRTIIPWIFGSAAAAVCAWQLAGKSTNVDVTLGIAFSIAVPAGIVKIFWDRSQKVRLRKRIEELEAENQRLKRGGRRGGKR